MKQPTRTFRASLLLLGLGLLFPVAAQQSKAPKLEQTLQASHWKKRVLLVAAPTAAHPDFRAQKAQLAQVQAQLTARDFLVVDVLYDHLTAADQQYFTKKTGLQPPRFAAVLVGKDGGVKLTSTRPIAPARLFGTVDKMPMRQREMQRGIVETD